MHVALVNPWHPESTVCHGNSSTNAAESLTVFSDDDALDGAVAADDDEEEDDITYRL
jgi:hypothetical protein